MHKPNAFFWRRYYVESVNTHNKGFCVCGWTFSLKVNLGFHGVVSFRMFFCERHLKTHEDKPVKKKNTLTQNKFLFLHSIDIGNEVDVIADETTYQHSLILICSTRVPERKKRMFNHTNNESSRKHTLLVRPDYAGKDKSL